MRVTESTVKPLRWRRWAGPLITLALVVTIELLSDTALRIPNPPAFLMLAIVFAAFQGGRAAGLISAALAWAYMPVFFSNPGSLFQYTDDNLRRVIVWAFAMPTTALMVGLLKDRAEGAAAAARTTELLQAHLAERQRDEERLRRTNRALQMISACNQVLVRADDEAELLRHICQTIVESGGYRLAWVGLAEHDEAMSVRPTAHYGVEAGELETLNLRWADTEPGRAPAGIAIRTGEPVVAHNLLIDPTFAPWRQAALQHGGAALMAVPLIIRGTTIGALNIYATEPEAFDAEEVRLLTELADDLAYGLAALRTRAAREQAEEQLRRNAARAQLMAELSRELAAVTTDYQTTIDTAARRMVEVIGDFCLIHLVSDDGEWLNPIAIQHQNPEALTATRDLLATGPRRADEGVSGRVVQTGQPSLIPVVDQAQVRAATKPEHRPSLDHFPIYSLLTVPLRAQGRVIGAVTVGRHRPEQPYSLDDQTCLQDLADRAALAIANARLLEETQRLNTRLEQRVAERTAQLEMEITERQRAEDEIHRAWRFVDSIVENIPNMIFVKDAQELRFVRFNRAGEALLGLSRDELIGKTDYDFFPTEAADDFTTHDRAVLAGRQLIDLPEEAIQTRHQGVRILHTQKLPILDEDGHPQYLLGISEDITERKQAEAEIRRLNQALAQKLAQLEAANQDLQEAKEEAERANQAKSEFLSRMSHELRTPLNAILGFAQILGMGDLDPRPRAAVEHILNAGRHLLDLINEVLDIARIESGRFTVSLEPVQAREVVQEILDVVQPLTAQRKVALQVERSALCDHHIRADRQRIKQVLLNLLSNAVKYNRAGGTVTVVCEELAGRLRIRVSDTGPGIAADKMARLFVAFDRLDVDESDVEGTGLGLALSKRLIEVMDGAIGVESVVGQGSSFWVELPIVEGPVEKLKRTGTGPLTPPPVREQTRTVLYVEDNPSNMKLVEEILSHRPAIRLLTAMQGRLSLDLARDHRPDLILLDLNLPDLPGAQVLSLLQADPATQAIPVVVLSADATPRQIERLLAAGARTYLTKPFDVKQFLQVLDELLA